MAIPYALHVSVSAYGRRRAQPFDLKAGLPGSANRSRNSGRLSNSSIESRLLTMIGIGFDFEGLEAEYFPYP